MTHALAFTRDDALAATAIAAAMARLDAVETRRKAIKLSQSDLCARAFVNCSTYRRALGGQILSAPATLQKLERAIAEAERSAQVAARTPLSALFRSVLATVCLAAGAELDAVMAADPHDNRPRNPQWLAAMRLRAAALHFLVTEYDVAIAAAARAAGVSKQAASKALRQVEDRRDDPAFDALMSKLSNAMVRR